MMHEIIYIKFDKKPELVIVGSNTLESFDDIMSKYPNAKVLVLNPFVMVDCHCHIIGFTYAISKYHYTDSELKNLRDEFIQQGINATIIGSHDIIYIDKEYESKSN